MKNIPTLIIALFSIFVSVAQDNGRDLLRGTVLYRDVPVPNQNVINVTTEDAVISSNNGQFAIEAKAGDDIAFTAINYQLKMVKVTQDMINNGRLVVEVKEKVTELDEVVVSPENQEQFIKLQNEEFKQVEYEIDRSTEVENISLSKAERGMQDGINFVNIFKALAKAAQKNNVERPRLKMSEVLRQVYDDEFFVVDLKLAQDQIDDFLVFVDARAPQNNLLLKQNEFQLIDFLVNQSKAYRDEVNGQN